MKLNRSQQAGRKRKNKVTRRKQHGGVSEIKTYKELEIFIATHYKHGKLQSSSMFGSMSGQPRNAWRLVQVNTGIILIKGTLNSMDGYQDFLKKFLEIPYEYVVVVYHDSKIRTNQVIMPLTDETLEHLELSPELKQELIRERQNSSKGGRKTCRRKSRRNRK